MNLQQPDRLCIISFLVGAFRRKTQTIVVTSFFLVGAFEEKRRL